MPPWCLGITWCTWTSSPIVQSLVTDRDRARVAAGRVAPGDRPCRLGAVPPLSPVVLEGRVIGGIGGGDEPMADNLGPGEFPEGGMPFLILKDPAVLPTAEPGPNTSGFSTSLIFSGDVVACSAERVHT